MKPLFVIMVTYRRFAHFKRTVDSLLPTLPPGSTLLIVDNASPELEYREYFSDITAPGAVKVVVLNRHANKGWGASVNYGLLSYPSWREHEYVLESNNDVEYLPGWWEKATAAMRANPQVGVLGLWKHVSHGTMSTIGDLVIKDQMPACAWLFRSKDLEMLLPFPEKGPTKIRGGNGEDTRMCDRIRDMGLWVCGLREDVALHMDGYDGRQGRENEAYL
jgi:hypothetical protein